MIVTPRLLIADDHAWFAKPSQGMPVAPEHRACQPRDAAAKPHRRCVKSPLPVSEYPYDSMHKEDDYVLAAFLHETAGLLRYGIKIGLLQFNIGLAPTAAGRLSHSD